MSRRYRIDREAYFKAAGRSFIWVAMLMILRHSVVNNFQVLWDADFEAGVISTTAFFWPAIQKWLGGGTQ